MPTARPPTPMPEELQQRLSAAWQAARATTPPPLDDLLALQAEWDRTDAERVRKSSPDAKVRYLAALGFPRENRHPQWAGLAPELRAPLQAYCLGLADRAREGEGAYLGSPVGAGKTCALALVALRARQLGLSCAYILAGWQLVEEWRGGVDPYAETDVLIIDDVDYVPSGGYQAEARGFDVIGRYLYLHYAEGGAVLLGSNLPFSEMAGKSEFARVGSRWHKRLPPPWRMHTDGPDQRGREAT